jgi:hypothetical protein
MLVTHDKDVSAAAGRIVAMRDGRVVSDGGDGSRTPVAESREA